MKSAGRWVKVTNMDGRSEGIRMLHEDMRGRLCIRYQREWHLVTEKPSSHGRCYQLGGLA